MRLQCGRADLVRALALGPEGLSVMARLIGYTKQPGQRKSEGRGGKRDPDKAPGEDEYEDSLLHLSELQDPVSCEMAPVPFLIPTNYELVARKIAPDMQSLPAPENLTGNRMPGEVPAFRPLATWRELLPRLRRVAAQAAESGVLDVGRLVQAFSQGRFVRRLPRKKILRWGAGVQIIDDRSRRLTPFWRDQDLLAARLGRLFPHESITYARLFEGGAGPVMLTRHGLAPYVVPSPGTLVIVLGDLGSLAAGPEWVIRKWELLGVRLQAAGCRTVALMPAARRRWPVAWLRHWTLMEWERPALSRSRMVSPVELTERLLRLVAPAIRIEPGLLRDIRLCSGAGGADAGVEADVWQHPALSSNHAVAATMHSDVAKRYRQAFEDEPETLRRAVLERVLKWRSALPREICYEELISLGVGSQSLVPWDLLQAARADLEQVGRLIESGVGGPEMRAILAMGERTIRRIPETAWHDRHVLSALTLYWYYAYQKDASLPVPSGMDISRISVGSMSNPQTVLLRQRGARIEAGHGQSGSLLTSMTTHIGLIQVSEVDLAGERDHFWQSGSPPSWADTWGWDGYGAWVEFVVGGVRQRMRWIPPGSFMMGSPEDEHDRYDDEGPQHRVTISSGYWLFDTACTQELWQAVMGENPSGFQLLDCPVEQVDFAMVQEFIRKINALIPGLALTLPSEAQWEYACRAGTTTPFSFGHTITSAQVNFDGNFPYLPDDPKGEYREESVPVASLPANPWGLFEMHGNVWEWCQDSWHDSYKGAPLDGAAWIDETDGRRVQRGGFWSLAARYTRSACRFWEHRIYGNSSAVGFRCARVQVSTVSRQQGDAEPRSARPVRLAERRTGRADTDQAEILDLNKSSGQAACSMPEVEAFQIRSDCEIVTFKRTIKPAWASGMGRDPYGLWATFTIGPVTQKMRWIPPGSFMMGSPEEEHDRMDREGPQHLVTLSSGYWLFDTACTQALWQAVMGENPSHFQSPDHPVEQVDFEMVQEFIKKINALIPGLALTLPSEAQWEYACRAGTTTPFSFGHTITSDQVNFNGNSPYQPEDPKGEYREKTVPVATLPVNPWGLFEMHGNVWEWCADTRHDSYDGAPTDGTAWIDEADGLRVLRGGSWGNIARHVRSACRFWSQQSSLDRNVGFRCARVQW
ncbi:MAG: formylglycine-generating enzyme family protein [Magnetococcales bacterium]|nr:formylglycine-generating enzyme family protein [Magnetococcales bacterium]NGZ05518.1 formylglycine-generating enzyme family protein [Magnetococcales bacterium]